MRTLALTFPLGLSLALAACASTDNRPIAEAADTEVVTAAPARAAVAIPSGPIEIRVHHSSDGNGSVNSYLLLGKTDAILVDTQLVESETAKLVELVKASGRKLTTIYVTHGHPDHFMGGAMLQREFPDAKLLAKARTSSIMPKLFQMYEAPLNKFFPGDVAKTVATPSPLEGDTLELEGTRIQVLELDDGESEYTTMLHIPSMKVLIAADTVYNRVHPWLNELRPEGVLAHARFVMGAPDVDVILPGHGDPMTQAQVQEYIDYVDAFLEMAKGATDANALVDAVAKRFPEYATLAGLRFSAGAFVARNKEKPAG